MKRATFYAPWIGLNEVFVAIAYAFSCAGVIGIAGSLICQSLTSVWNWRIKPIGFTCRTFLARAEQIVVLIALEEQWVSTSRVSLNRGNHLQIRTWLTFQNNTQELKIQDREKLIVNLIGQSLVTFFELIKRNSDMQITRVLIKTNDFSF